MAPCATTRRAPNKQHKEASMSMEFLSSLKSSEKRLLIEKKPHEGDRSEDISGCSTPRAKRYRLPETLSCPPPPKKKRMAPAKCSLRTSPITFFSPPDIELFFLFAFRDIST
ncbi:cyclin-dependent protein kinase inhibitor SMR9-like [Actinidia eriantha]|uniref:cyclin-dependent protein kinase inhibitor SMR9-like n=1 Tax=Actinidia eriantha TaxID=165200 RepID=UPI00258DFD1A|nr:cyclin-dependent protein kinase inhibitor SMR9-like [Actinidia eriantha]